MSKDAGEFVQPQSGFGLLVIGTQVVLLVLFGLLVDQRWSQVCPNGIAEICGAPSTEHTCTSTDAQADCTFTGASDCNAPCSYTPATAHSPMQYALAEERYYKIYLDIALMMLVGFGYLMTFLQHYGLGAVGFTMLITTLTVQWSIIVEGIFLVLSDADAHSFPMSISFLELIDGNFAAATVLISFGALIGKVGPTQVMALAMFEVVVYAANKRFLMMELIGIADIGGTVVIHCFGAYFGLAAAWVLGVPKDEAGNSDSSSISDIFSLIGTVFLWLYWPSFVTAMPGDSMQETTALLNTVFALLGSTVTTFGISAWLERSIRPVDIQNATLAGGVTVGATANFLLSPTGALGVGCLAGLISSLGFIKLQPALEEKGLHDSCGVHNLHGMPSVLGGLVSFVFLLINDDCKLNGSCKEEGQAVSQLIALAVTVAVALVTGALCGGLLKAIGQPELKFVDQAAWSASPPPTGPLAAPGSPPKVDIAQA